MGTREQRRIRRHARVLVKVRGTAVRPRLAVYRSLRWLTCQLIDDVAGRTLLYFTDRPVKGTRVKTKQLPVERARALGQRLAEAAKRAGVSQVVFDRGGFRYHGRIRALAEAAREAGLKL